METVRAEAEAIKKAAVDAVNDIVTTTRADPLTRTGPAAITVAVSTWLKVHVGLRWNAVTGLRDGGKAKLVYDVLVLPITGFRYVGDAEAPGPLL